MQARGGLGPDNGAAAKHRCGAGGGGSHRYLAATTAANDENDGGGWAALPLPGGQRVRLLPTVHRYDRFSNAPSGTQQ